MMNKNSAMQNQLKIKNIIIFDYKYINATGEIFSKLYLV